MHVAFVNLARSADYFRNDLMRAVSEVAENGHYILGPKVKSFERVLAAFIGVKYCAGVGSGTDAITLALMAYGIGQGDEVITSNLTAYPTITGIKRAGARAVTVDIFAESGLMNPACIPAKITARTKAIIPVHLYGQCCDMDRIMPIAREHDIVVIEDCAQSIGASYAGKKAGAMGDAACFSFYPTKNLACIGDGGAVITDSKKIHENIVLLRNYGQSDRYHHDITGLNSRLDELQAAILLVKFPHLEEANRRRVQIADIYRANLKHVDVIRCHDYGLPVYHLFVIKHKNRAELQGKLRDASIDTLIHYPIPVHMQKDFGYDPDLDPGLDISINFSQAILSLPVYPEMTESELEYVIDKINDYA